ncbi:MAG: hypothetical protein NTY07_09000 [Bacteroidia bacterium]|nr:hypothetical protein [Bacteroidia bacterium]
MELNELKKAWGKVSEAKDQNHLVNSDEIRQMLQRKGSGILSKLERNVRTGFWLLGIFLLLTIADQYIPYDRIFPSYLNEQIPTPLSIKIIGVIVNCIIMLTFILFVCRYHKLKIKNLAAENMRMALRKVIQLLDTFKKEFYLALIVFLCAACAGFVMGVIQGIKTMPGLETISQIKRIMGELFVLLVMVTILGMIFYIFHKGFNSLYGKYRQQLIGTLNELDETQE